MFQHHDDDTHHYQPCNMDILLQANLSHGWEHMGWLSLIGYTVPWIMDNLGQNLTATVQFQVQIRSYFSFALRLSTYSSNIQGAEFWNLLYGMPYTGANFMKRNALWEVNTVVQMYKFATIYKIKRFIAVFTRNCHWNIRWSRWIKSTPSHAVNQVLF